MMMSCPCEFHGRLTPSEYATYTQCWTRYLGYISRQATHGSRQAVGDLEAARVFTALQLHVPRHVRVQRWPGTAVEASALFVEGTGHGTEALRAFTRAVQAALNEVQHEQL